MTLLKDEALRYTVDGYSEAWIRRPVGRVHDALTAPDSLLAALLKTMHTDHLDWSLPAYHRGTLRGMDAVQELARTYLQRVLRWWAGKGPAAKAEDHQLYE